MVHDGLCPVLAISLLLAGSACGDSAQRSDSTVRTVEIDSAAGTARSRGALDLRKALAELTHTSWSIRDGLPQNSVHALVQSETGYIWVGTQEGLVRFNGLAFRVFDRANTAGIHSNHVTAIVESGPDQLVVGTYGGGLYRMTDMTATPITADAELSNCTVIALARGADGGLWIGRESAGLTFLDADSMRTFVTADGLPDNRIRALLVDGSGKVWVGTASGLATIFGGEVTLVLPAGLADVEITALALDPSGVVWVGTTSGLYRVAEGGRVRRYSTADGLLGNWVVSLFADGADNVLVGTVEGLSHLYDGRINSRRLAGGRSANIITALLVDREGIIWAGTATSGLHQLRQAMITSYHTGNGLTSDIVYAVHGSQNGGVWAGSYYGDIDYFENGAFRNVLPRSRLGSGRLRALHEDSRGRLWIGSEGALHMYAGGRLTTFTRADGFPRAPVRVVGEDRDGTIWVGTDGAGLFQVQNARLVRFHGDPDLPSQAVRAIHLDGAGRLWIGTYGGLSRLEGGGFVTYTVADGLGHENVRTIRESGDGTLWIGTYGGGLSRFRDGEFVNYSTANGLHHDAVYQILEDENGDLWMSSNMGIFRVRRSELEGYANGVLDRIVSVVYNETDGMLNRECNGGSPGGYRSATDGRLWFATVGGLAVVDVETIGSAGTAPVVIERFTVDNEEIPLSAEHILPPGKRRLTLEYAALNFLAPEKTQYRYRLVGYDLDWVDAGGSRTAQYTRLRPGSYRFEVQASIREGSWSSSSEAFRFYLKPAVYQRWWFYAASVLTVLAIAYASYRRRVYALQRNEQVLQAKVEEAIEELKVLHGLLPICSYCKKVRDDDGYWSQIEVYIREHSQAEFSHSLCPECIATHYPEFSEDVTEKEDNP